MNTATVSGGVYAISHSSLAYLENNITYADNSAIDGDGGVYYILSGVKVTIMGSTYKRNYSPLSSILYSLAKNT